MKNIFILFAVVPLFFITSFSQPKTKNIVVVTLDGFRWQEFFLGADSSILFNRKFTKDTSAVHQFWGSTINERRQKLMPFCWSVINAQGQLYGNRVYSNKVNCANPYWFSYPGYSELLVGFVDRKINRNDYGQNTNRTVLEFINEQPDFNKKVSVFCTWETVGKIAERQPNSFYINAGHQPVRDSDSTAMESKLNSLQGYPPDPLRTRNDFFTFQYAFEYLNKRRPRVLYLSFEETDRFGHQGDYSAYLNAAHSIDKNLNTLWGWIQSQADYKDQTTIIITTDHGRGAWSRSSWKNHGKASLGSNQTWFAVMGPDTPPLGEVTVNGQYYQSQLASTITTCLGLKYTNSRPVGHSIQSVTDGIPLEIQRQIKTKKLSLVVLPAVLRSPETKWGFGAAGSATFKTHGATPLTRTSNIQAIGLYTTRKQTIVGIESTIFFPKENYILRLHSTRTYFPDKFWGLGNHTDNKKPIPFAYKQFYVFPQLLRRVYSNLYFGVSLEYQHVYNISFHHSKKEVLYDSTKIVGLQGGIVPGAGILVTWDSRNNAFSPSSGEFFEFAATDFENRTRNYDYTNYVLDFRKYEQIINGGVFAFQFYANLNRGSIPILSLAAMGGGTIMRGYYSGRFRDNNLAATQLEYRTPIRKRIGGVIFAGVGQVAKRMGQFSPHQFKGAMGGGLRFAIKPNEKLNLRLDFGVAKHSHGFYLTVAEAF